MESSRTVGLVVYDDRWAEWEAMMDPLEGQAKAIIAAALIVRGAVEVPAIPSGTQRVPDEGGRRLRELTDYVYRLLTTDQPLKPE
jgi:hypothetical protein